MTEFSAEALFTVVDGEGEVLCPWLARALPQVGDRLRLPDGSWHRVKQMVWELTTDSLPSCSIVTEAVADAEAPPVSDVIAKRYGAGR